MHVTFRAPISTDTTQMPSELLIETASHPLGLGPQCLPKVDIWSEWQA